MEQTNDRDERARLHQQAISSMEKSVAVWSSIKNRVGVASSYYQLGLAHRMLGQRDKTEKYFRQGLEIYESLNHPEVHTLYAALAQHAHDQGDAKAAVEWQAKCDAKIAELTRLRHVVEPKLVLKAR